MYKVSCVFVLLFVLVQAFYDVFVFVFVIVFVFLYVYLLEVGNWLRTEGLFRWGCL